MKKINLTIITIIAVLLLAQASWGATSFDPATAAFGARPMSLGGAFIGQADDTNAIFLNPAGLALIDKWSVTSMYTKLLDTVDYRLLGGTYKTEYGTIGLGYIGTSNPAGYLTGTSTNDVSGKISFDTHELIISYGNELNKLIEIEGLPEETLIGANLKVLSQGLTGGDQNDKSGFGFNIDLGAVTKVTPWSRAGLTLNNVIPGTMSWASGTNEDMPMKLNLGSAFNIMGPAENSIYEGSQTLTGVLDASLGFAREEGFSLHAGLEWKPIKYVNIRCGLDQANVSAGDGSTGSVFNLTAGVGFSYAGITFDYAFHQDANLEANQNHYFSISYSPQEIKQTSAQENKEKSKTAKAEDPGYYFDESGYLIIEDDEKEIDIEKELELDLENETSFLIIEE